MDNDTATSASCRIVVVSSTLGTAKNVATRIKTLAGDESSADDNLGVINWTIKNKYYTAPVHFQPIHIEGLELLELDDVPAVIYAWGAREPYKNHLKILGEEFDSLSTKPEVVLAVHMNTSVEGVEEDFITSAGFEYIDGQREVSRKTNIDFESSPGLNRAIDALSTIMWPSMTRISASKKQVSELPSAQLLGESSYYDLRESGLVARQAATDARSARQREMEQLERWLEAGSEDEDMCALEQRARPINIESTDLSNTEDPWTTGSPRPDSSQTTSEGFEDDFSDFVSAPPIAPISTATTTAATATARKVETDDTAFDSDTDMPKEADIQASKSRIFGPLSRPRPLESLPSQPSSEPSFAEALRSVQSELSIDSDTPAFDLSRVLRALDDMKAEVALIPDEAERRKAAAQVALGLVYGLEEMRNFDDEEDEEGLIEQ